MRNIAQLGRREVESQRDLVQGVTSSTPRYEVVDPIGNKNWVADVYVGPFEDVETAIIKSVPIAPYAKELVTDLRQPVMMFRSKQGKYTIVGRAETMIAGAQMPDGSVSEPNYTKCSYNLAELGLEHLADLTYTIETLGGFGAVLRPTPDTPLRIIRAYDAFGAQVLGPELAEDFAIYSREPIAEVKVRHMILKMATLGPPGAPGAMKWGSGPLQPAIPEIVEA